MSTSRLANIWETLRSSDLDEQFVSDFQEWVQSEEFDCDALIDDINDKEDQSSIYQWIKEENYSKSNAFLTIRKLITPPSYHNSNITKHMDDEYSMRFADDDEMKTNEISWSGLRPVIITKIEQKQSVDSIPFDINDAAIDTVTKLNEHFKFDQNPGLVTKTISELQVICVCVQIYMR